MPKFIDILKFIRKNILILLILWIAFAVRTYHPSEFPPSLNWDEVSHGYNAYSILKTGMDEWGKRLPIIFRAYGDYKLPVYVYLTAFSESLLGLNATAVRLPSMLAGVVTVFLAYLVGKKLFNKKIGLLTALLVTVEPWSLFLSRGAFEANLALTFILAGFYFFLLSLKKQKFLSFSLLFFGLSVWTYNSARIFTPFFIVALVFIYKENLTKVWINKKKSFLFPLLIALFLFAPMIIQMFNPEGQARYSKVSILDEGTIVKINETRISSNLSPTLARLFYNKGTFFAGRFVKNYFSHFTPKFLFLEGGSHYQFSVQGHGLIYLVNLPFFAIGLFVLLKRKDKASFVILSWLLLAPVASSVTREAPHVLRSIVFLPIPMLLSAIGAMFSYGWVKKRIGFKASFLAGAYFFFLLLQVENYGYLAATKYLPEYSWSWQYGHEEMVDFVKENYDSYDNILVTKKYGEPHEFFLFHWPWDPQKYLDDFDLIRFYQSGWYWVDGFDKFYFVNDWQIPEKRNESFFLESGKEVSCEKTKCLLVTSPGNAPTGWTMVKEINFLDNKKAFEIYEN